MTKKKEAPKSQDVKTEASLADFTLFFELENILVKAREHLYKQVAESMKAWDKTFTIPEFSRYCLYPLPSHFVPKLVTAFDLTSERTGQWAAQLEAARIAYLTSPDIEVHKGMKNLIEAARAKGLPVCALSALTPSQTQALIGNAGLGDAGIEMFCSEEVDANFPRADTWMKMARELNKTSRRCVVFAASTRACKAALSSGMRSVAVPDALTAFQDFSGTEMILENEKDWKSDDIINFPSIQSDGKHRMRGQSLKRLLEIMETLRSEQGCPWDREQTLESLKPCLVEETYEVLDALDSGDRNALKEELGDLLLQVVFQAQLCHEEGVFDFDDVAQSICDKLIRRHPHIFADAQADTPEEVIRHWEAIKQAERGGEKRSVLAGVPKSMPPMQRAYQIQRKASRVGFDWPDVRGVADKVSEELREVEEALECNDASALREELGDLLFAVINLCRFSNVSPDDALQDALAKFERRFRSVEQALEGNGQVMQECSPDELDRLWNHAKRTEKDGFLH